MGTKASIHQTSADTKTMMEIAGLLAEAQDDFSALDVSMWFPEYKGPPDGAELFLSQNFAKGLPSSTDNSDPLYPALTSVLRLYAKESRP